MQTPFIVLTAAYAVIVIIMALFQSAGHRARQRALAHQLRAAEQRGFEAGIAAAGQALSSSRPKPTIPLSPPTKQCNCPQCQKRRRLNLPANHLKINRTPISTARPT